MSRSVSVLPNQITKLEDLEKLLKIYEDFPKDMLLDILENLVRSEIPLLPASEYNAAMNMVNEFALKLTFDKMEHVQVVAAQESMDVFEGMLENYRIHPSEESYHVLIEYMNRFSYDELDLAAALLQSVVDDVKRFAAATKFSSSTLAGDEEEEEQHLQVARTTNDDDDDDYQYYYDEVDSHNGYKDDYVYEDMDDVPDYSHSDKMAIDRLDEFVNTTHLQTVAEKVTSQEPIEKDAQEPLTKQFVLDHSQSEVLIPKQAEPIELAEKDDAEPVMSSEEDPTIDPFDSREDEEYIRTGSWKIEDADPFSSSSMESDDSRVFEKVEDHVEEEMVKVAPSSQLNTVTESKSTVRIGS